MDFSSIVDKVDGELYINRARVLSACEVGREGEKHTREELLALQLYGAQRALILRGASIWYNESNIEMASLKALLEVITDVRLL